MWILISYAALALLSSCWLLFKEVRTNFHEVINTSAFVAQIQKLIMANNIDRAIKLCNATHESVVGHQIKQLLCKANRSPEDLEAQLRESIDSLQARQYFRMLFGKVFHVFAVLSDIGMIVVTILIIPTGVLQYVVVGSWILTRIISTMALTARGYRLKHFRDGESAVLKVHGLLLNRKRGVSASQW